MAFYEDNSISHDITANAGFREWVKMLQKALEECGIVKTADTGQINTETVETPASNNTYSGYNIWRFNDANQATEPVYFKLEYGRSGTASIPKLRWTVGTGSNGSGTISNASNANTPIVETSPSEKGNIHCCFSEDTLILSAIHALGGTSGGQHLIIERSRHPVTFELMGVILASGATANNPFAGVAMRSGGTWSTFANGNGTMIDCSPVLGNLALPGYGVGLVAPAAPSIAIVSFRSGDVAVSETGKVKIRGKERTYKRLKNTVAHTVGVGSIQYMALHE